MLLLFGGEATTLAAAPEAPSATVVNCVASAVSESSKIDAINEMLSITGSLRTNSLSSTRPDVVLALQVLMQTDRSLQTDGWHFNTQYNQTFSPNADSEVVLPIDIFEVRESSGTDGPKTLFRNNSDYAIRGGKLYNALDDDFVFEADVSLNVIRRVDFGDLPQYARNFVTASAAAEFYEIVRGATSPRAAEKEQRARAAFFGAEYRNTDANFFAGIDTAWPHLGR